MQLIVKEKNAGQRVDLFVLSKRSSLTRSATKKLIKKGIIKVNNRNVLPNYKIKSGEVIQIDVKKIDDFLRNDDEGGLSEIKPVNMKLEIIYEDSDVIVCNKPEGTNSHPVTKNDTRSVLNGLQWETMRSNENTNNNNPKLRLTHRLDKETSGVLMATKNLEAHSFYSKQFEDRRAKKEYLAVVHGNFEKFLINQRRTSARVESNIARERGPKRRFENVENGKGQRAVSEIFFERSFNKFGKGKFSIVRIEPQTGRTHQIRVHLSGLGFPILGDKLYGGQKYKRLMLHAWKLKVKRFNNVEYEEKETENNNDKFFNFIAEIPDKFDMST